MADYTYRQYLNSLKNSAAIDPNSKQVLAQALAVSLHMQWDGAGAKCDFDAVDATASKLMKQKSFKALAKDPLAFRLAREGRHLELIQMLDNKENEIRKQTEDYIRSPKAEDVKKDADFLTAAADALKNGSAKGRPAELEKKSPRYIEMMKQVEAAQAKTAGGVQLSAAENKAMITALQKYINGGTKIAGGPKKVPHFKEAMCVLKEFMPPDDFRKYVNRINEAHPKSRTAVDAFIFDRMVNKVKTAEEIRAEVKGSMRVGFNENDCATLLAVNNLSKGDRNALITPEQLEAEKQRLLESGSAMNRALSSPMEREFLRGLAMAGKMKQLGQQLDMASKHHAIGAAQWQVNRSIKMLTQGPANKFFATDHLANILVAHELASGAGPGTKIDKAAFDLAKENIKQDPAFKKLAERYNSDPAYRERINKDLLLDKSGSILPLEMHTIKNPPQRQRPQAQAGNDGLGNLNINQELVNRDVQPQQGVPMA